MNETKNEELLYNEDNFSHIHTAQYKYLHTTYIHGMNTKSIYIVDRSFRYFELLLHTYIDIYIHTRYYIRKTASVMTKDSCICPSSKMLSCALTLVVFEILFRFMFSSVARAGSLEAPR